MTIPQAAFDAAHDNMVERGRLLGVAVGEFRQSIIEMAEVVGLERPEPVAAYAVMANMALAVHPVALNVVEHIDAVFERAIEQAGGVAAGDAEAVADDDAADAADTADDEAGER